MFNYNHLLCLVLSIAIFATGCKDEPRDDGMFAAADEVEHDREGVREQIEELSAAKTMEENLDDEVRYIEAREALIQRGSGIQSILFEELAVSDDWGVRFGIVEVLSAVGTKRMVEPLISVLDDQEPRVAWMAMQTLRIVCDYRLVPLEENENEDNKLPPIPVGDGGADSQNRLWREWHGINGKLLHDAWQEWWKANAQRVSFE